MTKAEFIEKNGIVFHPVNLPTTIKGFSYHDDEGRYIVIYNSRLDAVTNRNTADHEMRHITRGDHSRISYKEYV